MLQDDIKYVRFIEHCSNHYQVLDVKNGAKSDEIKKSFKFLSKKIHPDKNKGMCVNEFML